MKITNLEKIVRISQEGNPRFLSLEEDSTRSYVSFYIEERSDEEEERSLGDEDLGENQEVRSATTRSFVSFDIEERSDDEEKRSVGDEELGRNQEASSTFSDGGYQGDSECTDDEQLVGVEDFDDLAFTEPIEGDDKGYIPEAPPTPKRRNNKPTDAVDEGSDRPDSIAELLENLRMSNGDLSSVEKPIRRHVKNFHYAQNQRAKKHRFRPFGIIGLFCNLSGIRSDLHWAGDAAWRRRHGKPHISWEDFEAKRNKGLGFPFFTCLIIMASISMMIIAFYMNGWKIEDMEINPLYGPSPDTLLKIGALEAQVMIETGTWWRLVTPICLHGGIIHLTINIVTIGILGRAVERNHGFVNTAILFFVPAIGGNIISGVMQPRCK